MPALTKRTISHRKRWEFKKAPDQCDHLDGAFFDPIDDMTTQKRCRGCGTTLFEHPRCQGTTKSGRQCWLPGLVKARCHAHPEDGAKKRPRKKAGSKPGQPLAAAELCAITLSLALEWLREHAPSATAYLVDPTGYGEIPLVDSAEGALAAYRDAIGGVLPAFAPATSARVVSGLPPVVSGLQHPRGPADPEFHVGSVSMNRCRRCYDQPPDNDYYTVIEPDGTMLQFCSPRCLRGHYPSSEVQLRWANAEYWRRRWATEQGSVAEDGNPFEESPF